MFALQNSVDRLILMLLMRNAGWPAALALSRQQNATPKPAVRSRKQYHLILNDALFQL